jgi:hypothetical protein
LIKAIAGPGFPAERPRWTRRPAAGVNRQSQPDGACRSSARRAWERVLGAACRWRAGGAGCGAGRDWRGGAERSRTGTSGAEPDGKGSGAEPDGKGRGAGAISQARRRSARPCRSTAGRGLPRRIGADWPKRGAPGPARPRRTPRGARGHGPAGDQSRGLLLTSMRVK